MQSIEDFMYDFFLNRTSEIKRELKAREPFRDKFFTDNCLWDRRKGVVEESQTETIVNISKSGNQATVLTNWKGSLAKDGRKLRYHLLTVAEGWRINCVEFECPMCHGLGEITSSNQSCGVCSGKGWFGIDSFPNGGSGSTGFGRYRRQ
jgi:hypothetical protein